MNSAFADNRKPWLPCCREDWTTLQVKRRFEIRLGKMLQNAPLSKDDLEVPYLKAQHIQWEGVRLHDLPSMWATKTEINALALEPGDLLVCEGGEVGRGALLKEPAPENCIIQNALHRVRPTKVDSTAYLAFLLKQASTHDWFDVLCNKSTISHFTTDKFGEMWIALPPPETQRAIADYLDRETAHIDALIAAKQRLLALLAEKRRALITQAVTRGLDADAPLRESGVEWLGQIPAHWGIERARWLFKERDERSTRGMEELLTVSHLTGVTPRSEKNVTMFESETTEGYKICLAGDLVINTLWAWMGAMGVSAVEGIVSPAYNVYTPNDKLLPAFVDSLVRMRVFADEATRYSKGVWSSRLRLYPEGFFEICIPLPPLAEQRAIVAHIAAETARLDALAAAAERTIALLRERRAALIAAAVTGQVNLPA